MKDPRFGWGEGGNEAGGGTNDAATLERTAQ
jgi:hypothetical protein